ncbi:MAG: T9SS type A sorting domain-containing protein [Candidatus Cloacimonetes bacterium]|nr:T9SS type A sorting domain-containing protein [Candidatus Cloacimonadota bacterium]MDY0172568.1 FlgD immunoglobulin-like domain containing protein [Candidatus Cloacimonadaceae bacterium]
MENKLKAMLTLCLFTVVLNASWAITVIVGSGATTTPYLPINTSSNFSYSQQIYTQTQIDNAGLIKSISFFFESGDNANSSDWVVYLGHTNKDSFSWISDWVPVVSLTKVYDGTVTFSTGGWMTVFFSTPFPYNNTDNLVVAIDENTPESAGSNGNFHRFTNDNYTGLYVNQSENIDPASPPSGTGRTHHLSQIRFDIEIDNPTGVTAIPDSETQINLFWTRNSTPDNVMVAWNSTNTFGNLEDITKYLVNDTIAGGGTVIYKGNGTSFSHTSLSANTSYYYKVWSVRNDGARNVAYSPGVATNAQTLAQTLPVELSSFTVALNSSNQAVLTWVTQTETDLSGFYIYRNTYNDLATAELISSLISATNTSQQRVYVFRDTELSMPGTYYYWLQVADLDGSESFHGPVNLVFEGENNHQSPGIPEITTLKTVYPNPFNPSTTISYGLDKAAAVSIRIYNSRGQMVREINEGNKAAGNFSLVWNGDDDRGKSLPTGVYYIRMQAGDKSFSKKAVLMK